MGTAPVHVAVALHPNSPDSFLDTIMILGTRTLCSSDCFLIIDRERYAQL
jgi:hypothetical protein